MKDYIQQAMRTCAPTTPELQNRMLSNVEDIHAMFGLQTEIGELVDGYKRHIFYGATMDRTNAAEEVGDILWYLAILMDKIGIDFEQCMVANIEKLRKRFPDKFTEHEAVNRDLSAERKSLDDNLKLMS